MDHEPDLDGGSAADEHAVAELSARLATQFPAVDTDRIADSVRRCLDDTRDAKVQNFRLVLAERAARRRLASETRTNPLPGAASPAAVHRGFSVVSTRLSDQPERQPSARS